MSGEVGYVDYDPATGTQGYWFDQFNDRMVLLGQVKVKGTAHYAVQVGASDFKLYGTRAFLRNIEERGGPDHHREVHLHRCGRRSTRGQHGRVHTLRQHAVQPPAGADRCRHVAEGETSFALDYVDGVPSVGGLPTHASGRVRFTGVTAG